MKSQSLILLIIAGACGLVAMLGVKQYLARQNQQEVVPTVDVLVATTVIKPGDRLDEMNTQFKTLEIGSFPEGVVTDLEQIKERALKVPRGIGDWIMVDQLTEKGGFGTGGLIPPGMRVATIPVDATTHHSGMLQPGNRIDLFLTWRDRDATTGLNVEKIRPILEFVEVFAVDNNKYGVDQGGENIQARNISLLVTPEQMMTLQLAKKKGTISTSLRNNEDTDSIATAVMTEDVLESARTEVDETSILDGDDGGIAGFRIPEAEPKPERQPEPTMQAQLLSAMNDGKTGPVTVAVAQPNDTWTMAIYEGNGIRVEQVNLASDVPVDTRGSYGGGGFNPALGGTKGAGGDPKAAGPGGPSAGGPGGSVPGLDALTDEETQQDLIEQFSELTDSLF